MGGKKSYDLIVNEILEKLKEKVNGKVKRDYT